MLYPTELSLSVVQPVKLVAELQTAVWAVSKDTPSTEIPALHAQILRPWLVLKKMLLTLSAVVEDTPLLSIPQ
jgi:hypothetical protein